MFEYSKTCHRDYKSVIDAYNVAAAAAVTTYTLNTDTEKKDFMFTYDAATGIAKYPIQSGNYEYANYCDGGAATLVAATTAAVAVTISLY